MIRSFVRLLLLLYYARIYVRGKELLPLRGPVLFVANHPNSLIDPLVVGAVAKRNVRFLAKAPLFDIPVFGDILRALGMVPVYRRSDDPSLVGKNTEMLAQAAKALARGECVGIFPEGKTHDAVRLDQVKTGAARIARQAIDAGCQNLQIVPLGLNYQEKDRFRSAIWVEVGRPLEAVQFFKADLEDAAQVRGLTLALEQALKGLVIHLENESWEEFLPELEHLLPLPGWRRSALAEIAQRKRIADAMNYFYHREHALAEGLAERIRKLRLALAAAGLKISSDLFRLRGVRLWMRQCVDLLFIFLAALPSLFGTLYNIVPYFITRPVARRFIEPGRTTTAFYHLTLGVPVYLLWYLAAGLGMAAYFTPQVAWVCTLTAPCAGLFALSFWGRLSRFGSLWWQELILLTHGAKLAALRNTAEELRHDLAALAQRYRTQPGTSFWEAPLPLSPYRLTLRIISTIVLLLAVFLLYERPPGAAQLEDHPAQAVPFTSLSDQAIVSMCGLDEQLLLELFTQLPALEQRAYTLVEDFKQGKRSYYHQDDDNEIRRQLLSYLSIRSELLKLAWRYRTYAEIRNEPLRLRAFLLGLSSASAIYTFSSKFVQLFDADTLAQKKLNEPEPLWGLPADSYSTIRAKVAEATRRGELQSAYARYERENDLFLRRGLLQGSPYAAEHAQIAAGRRMLTDNAGRLSLIPAPDGIGKEVLRSLYGGQAFVSIWLGDTRVRHPHNGQPLISPQDLETMRHKLQPGDILVERQNWFLSRAFMPGYWAHAALYIGTPEELQRLGIASDARVAPLLAKLRAPNDRGHQPVIIEAVPRGVRFNTLEECIGIADSAAVLRPKLPPQQISEAIARALSHFGKAYDFNFDFFSSDKIVCTELVYRAYDSFLKFPLVDVLGRKTMPPTELVRSFTAARNSAAEQYELIAFLDGDEERGSAIFKDEEAFAKTVDRPSMTWMQ